MSDPASSKPTPTGDDAAGPAVPVPDIAGIDGAQVADWAGGLGPDQQHVAVLGADVAHRLAENYRNGVLDEAGPVDGG